MVSTRQHGAASSSQSSAAAEAAAPAAPEPVADAASASSSLPSAANSPAAASASSHAAEGPELQEGEGFLHRILSHRTAPDGHSWEFLCEWYEDDGEEYGISSEETWEPAENLTNCKDILDDVQ